MRSLAANGNSRAVELIEKADELDKMIDADPWDTEQVLGGILWRGGWCGGSGDGDVAAVLPRLAISRSNWRR